MTTIINGSSPSITFSDGSAQTSATRPFLNRIINGAMVIDQRNAGASITGNDDTFPVDRFRFGATQTSKLTGQQNAGSVTPPSGFRNYLGATSSSAYSVVAGDLFFLQQNIEGFNVADLGWGTANAQTVTLSFWVRSSLTGTFGGSLMNSAVNRSYPYSYTISAANTWEYKTVTIAGDTSGTWLTTNGIGIRVTWSLGAGSTYSGTAGAWNGNYNTQPTGSVSVVGTNGATFYITGVQLEVGSTATSFDYRPYGTEFDLCRRYFERFSPSVNYQNYALGQAFSSTSAFGSFFFYPKRAAVTVAYPAASNFLIYDNTGTGRVATSVNAGTLGTNAFEWSGSVASGLTAGNASGLTSNNTLNSYVNISAEL